MRIVGSSVSLSAATTVERSEVQQGRVVAWIGDPPPPEGARSGGPPRATPASPALPAQPAGNGPAMPATPAIPADPASHGRKGRADGEADPASEGRSPRDEITLLILRRAFRLTAGTRAAQAIHRAYADGEEQAAAAGEAVSRAQAETAAPPAPPPARAGWGLQVDLAVTSVERTAVSFRAAAQVTTADGRRISTAASLDMERVSATTAEVHVRAGDARVTDPLAVNLAGGPVSLSGTQRLDLDGDGQAEEVAQLASGSAWLARDLDGSDAVEAGTELFGPATGDGFGELAALDADGNGWVDEGDRAFAELALWDGETLTPLAAAGIGAISTGSVATSLAVTGDGDAPAGQIRATGLYLREDGGAGTLQHVDLAV
jgi:hypothetical protein